MDGMEEKLLEATKKRKPKIAERLIEATFAAIVAGLRDKMVTKLTTQYVPPYGRWREKKRRRGVPLTKRERLLKQVGGRVSDSPVLPTQRPHGHRSGFGPLADRRIAILVPDEQVQIPSPRSRNRSPSRGRADGTNTRGRSRGRAVEPTDEIFFLGEPPLDYSFCMLNYINETLEEDEDPQPARNFKQPQLINRLYRTSSMRLSYNYFDNLDGLANTANCFLYGRAMGLVWVDISCNRITSMDLRELKQLPNLRIFYLHGNLIEDMWEVKKLGILTQLKSLSLHGNPVDQEDGYRMYVLSIFPGLTKLDFTPVTRGDRANRTVTRYGDRFEKHWERRHRELERKARAEALEEAKQIPKTQTELLAEALDKKEMREGGKLEKRFEF